MIKILRFLLVALAVNTVILVMQYFTPLAQLGPWLQSSVLFSQTITPSSQEPVSPSSAVVPSPAAAPAPSSSGGGLSKVLLLDRLNSGSFQVQEVSQKPKAISAPLPKPFVSRNPLPAPASVTAPVIAATGTANPDILVEPLVAEPFPSVIAEKGTPPASPVDSVSSATAALPHASPLLVTTEVTLSVSTFLLNLLVLLFK